MEETHYDRIICLVGEVIYHRTYLFSALVRIALTTAEVLPPNTVTFENQKHYTPDLFRDLTDPYCKALLHLDDGLADLLCRLINKEDLDVESLDWLTCHHPYSAPCSLEGALPYEPSDYEEEICNALHMTINQRALFFQSIMGFLEKSQGGRLEVPAGRAFYTDEYRCVSDTAVQSFLEVCDLLDCTIFQMFILDFRNVQYMVWEDWGFSGEDLV